MGDLCFEEIWKLVAVARVRVWKIIKGYRSVLYIYRINGISKFQNFLENLVKSWDKMYFWENKN